MIHIVTGLGLGGAETVMSRVIRATPNVVHEVISLGGRQWFTDVLEKRGVRVHHANMRSLSLPGLIRIARLIRASEAHVVQCWMYRANLVGGLIRSLTRVPTIWNIRCASLDGLRRGARLVAKAGGVIERWGADFVISCSERSIASHRQLGYGRAPGSVIPNGYDPKAFAPNQRQSVAVRKRLGIARDKFLIGSISRWDPQKDLPTFLAALRALADRGLPVASILIGHGLDPANSEFMDAVEAAGCGDLVIALGKQPDVRDLAAAMDLHVLSSIAEGFPNAVAETMLSGTPNAVTDAGDAALIVRDTGWVVPPRSPQLLADAIERAFDERRSSPQAWAARKRKTRERIAENFDLSRMAVAYEKIWKAAALYES